MTLDLDIAAIGARVFAEQGQALLTQSASLPEKFPAAVDALLATRGKVIVCGMGKSGIIGRKIAATLASTGTSSFFVHPGEAFHGDLGMIAAGDCVLLISNSGETEEVRRLLPYLKHIQATIIAITGKPGATLARQASITLVLPLDKEACPNNLAPTTSATLTLVLGDALAIALMARRRFQPEDFARFHPGGALGKKLLTTVAQVMHAHLPCNQPGDSFQQVVGSMTAGCQGLSVIRQPGQAALGIITDGDLRRAIERHHDLKRLTAAEIMTRNPISIGADCLLSQAEALMVRHKVTALLALDGQGLPVGIVKSLAL
jgi:arabinose-5-phosphate isomerase